MTFDELVQAFDKAYCEKLDDAEGTRAGVRAVVLALRDEIAPPSPQQTDDWEIKWPTEALTALFNEIIGSDAGADAARKAYWDKHYGTDEPAPGPAFYLEEAAPIPQSAIDKLTASAIGKDFRFTHTSLGPVPQNTDPAPAVCEITAERDRISDLLEKVAMAMWDTSDPSQWEKEMAGKAIAAVAEWLDEQGFDSTDLAIDLIAELKGTPK